MEIKVVSWFCYNKLIFLHVLPVEKKIPKVEFWGQTACAFLILKYVA